MRLNIFKATSQCDQPETHKNRRPSRSRSKIHGPVSSLAGVAAASLATLGLSANETAQTCVGDNSSGVIKGQLTAERGKKARRFEAGTLQSNRVCKYI